MTMGQPAPTGADAREAAVPRIIIEQERDLECQDLRGCWRWTAQSIYHEHDAQVSYIQHVANNVVAPHRHTVDEVMLLLEGGLTLHGTAELLGPGSVIFLGANNAYGFDVGPEGVKWLMVRPRRPNVDAKETDLQWGEAANFQESRGEFIAGPVVEELPWTRVGDGLEARRVIETAGYPQTSFFRVSASNTQSCTAPGRPHYLLVTEGTLRLGDRVVDHGGLVSIRPRETYLPVAEGGHAAFFLVEEAVDAPR